MIKEFITYLTAIRGYSEQTATAYEKALTDFARWYREASEEARWSTVTREVIDNYMIALTTAGHQPSTINQRISAISSLMKYQLRQGLRKDNPCRWESRKKLPKRLPNIIEPQAIGKAIQTTDRRTALALQILMTTGIRHQELLDLRTQDIDLSTGAMRIHGKGAKERQVYAPMTTCEMINAYMEGKEGQLFAGIDQRTMRSCVYEALRRYSNAKQLSPHAIRHTFATRAAQNGMPTATLAKLLGHESVETTQRYIDFGTEDVQDAYNKYMNF